MKRITFALCLTLTVALLTGSGLAQSCSPTATSRPCAPVSCPLACGICADGASCRTCDVCASLFYTAIPAATAQPAATPCPGTSGCTATAAPVRTPASTPESTGHYTTESYVAQEQKALNLLNQDRAAHNLPALTVDPALSALARMKSRDMNDNHYFAHQSPTLGRAADMLRANGYAFVSVGENIAHHATVEKAQAAFISSDGHRTNILGAQWQKVGIGVWVDDNGYVYVTQLFVR